MDTGFANISVEYLHPTPKRKESIQRSSIKNASAVSLAERFYKNCYRANLVLVQINQQGYNNGEAIADEVDVLLNLLPNDIICIIPSKNS